VPEGHTIHRLARDHAPLLVGRQVRASSPQGRFAAGAELLTGRAAESIEPYGKHLFYGFEGHVLLHVHLGLYGAWLTGRGLPPAAKGALRLRLLTEGPDGGAWLDLRGPTACELYTRDDRDRVVARLGPDPLRRDADPERAWRKIARSRTPVGALLMDQSVLAGVGNVYRAEVLYRAGLSPFRPGREVPRQVWDGIWDDLRVLLRAGVRAGRIVTTARADRDRRSGPPARADSFYVYRRAGLPCRRCRTPIRTELMVARNLFWCPLCQPG
jgi:endonuclease-8